MADFLNRYASRSFQIRIGNMSLLPDHLQDSEGIEVAWEDQQRINAFSKLNTRLTDIQDDLKTKEREKDYYDDLETELELADEDEPVLYKLGETFFHLSLPAAQKQLRSDLKRYEAEIEALRSKADDCESQMKDLKVHLKAKFGEQINLEK